MFEEIFAKLGQEYEEIEKCIKEGKLADAFYLIDKKKGTDALFLKSIILILLNKYDKALEILEEMNEKELDLIPVDVFYEMMGTCYYYGKNYLEASRCFVLSLDFNGKNFYSKYNLANIYLVKKDYSKALVSFEELLEHEPENLKIKENIEKLNKLIKKK